MNIVEAMQKFFNKETKPKVFYNHKTMKWGHSFNIKNKTEDLSKIKIIGWSNVYFTKKDIINIEFLKNYRNYKVVNVDWFSDPIDMFTAELELLNIIVK